MELRFRIDRNECFRRGIDTTDNHITLDIDPAKLTERQRRLIVDRIENGNYLGRIVALPSSVRIENKGSFEIWTQVGRPWGSFMVTGGGHLGGAGLLGVPGITLEVLLEAIEEDERDLEKQCKLLARMGKLMTAKKHEELVMEFMEKGNKS